jgi:uncharacterized protein
MELSRYVKLYPCQEKPASVLVYSTLRGSKLTVSDALAEKIVNGSVAGPELETLLRLGILVEDAALERERVRSLFELSNRHGRRFSALVALNLDCNLACRYCFEDHFRGKSYMSEATADLLVQTLINGQVAQGKDLHLAFYGGEALLSPALIRRISQPLLQAAARQGTGYSFGLVTNGTLFNSRTVAELLPLGLSGAKITLDGPPDIHDRQRPFAAGMGSFASILANLTAVCGTLPVQLGGNFSRYNYRRFPELLDLLLDQGITPDRLQSVAFAPITPKAGEAGKTDFDMGCACSGESWLMEAAMYLRGEILRRGFNTPKPRLAGCMVEFENELVVGFDGALFKCPAFMGWPDMQVGSLATGISDPGASHGLGAWKNEECLNCAYLPLCFGGCRFLRRLNTGSVAGLDCRREYFDATLEQMVRQDLTFSKVRDNGKLPF